MKTDFSVTIASISKVLYVKFTDIGNDVICHQYLSCVREQRSLFSQKSSAHIVYLADTPLTSEPINKAISLLEHGGFNTHFGKTLSETAHNVWT